MEKIINYNKEQFIEYLHIIKGYTLEYSKFLANIYY